MSRKRPSADDPEDAELFREAVGPVRKLSLRHKRVVQKHQPAPRARMRERDERSVIEELNLADVYSAEVETGEELLFRREECPPRILRRLRQGGYSVAGEVDLHHMNAQAAASSIAAFLNEAHQEGWSCVKIIHGKGLRSNPRGPVLKRLTSRLLARRSDVMAYASAPPANGGTGAVLVLLKSR